MTFQQRLGTLWHAFLHPKTPFYLKAVMVAVIVYLISPVDLMPDFFAIIGWIDDVLLVTLAMNWIMKRLPEEVLSKPEMFTQNDPTSRANRGQDPERFSNEYDGPIINGKARRN